MNESLNDEGIADYLMEFHLFKDSVRNSSLGRTAKLWVSYMDHVWLVLSFIMAVKSNNLQLYKHCLFKMCDLFFAYESQKLRQVLDIFCSIYGKY